MKPTGREKFVLLGGALAHSVGCGEEALTLFLLHRLFRLSDHMTTSLPVSEMLALKTPEGWESHVGDKQSNALTELRTEYPVRVALQEQQPRLLVRLLLEGFQVERNFSTSFPEMQRILRAADEGTLGELQLEFLRGSPPLPPLMPLADLPSEDVQLGEIIGRGTFSVVRRAQWEGFPVAVKVLTSHPPLRSLRREVDLLRYFASDSKQSSLAHPHVIHFFGLVKVDSRGTFGMVSELLEGSLYDLLHSPGTSLKPRDQLHLALDISYALSYFHSQRISHNVKGTLM